MFSQFRRIAIAATVLLGAAVFCMLAAEAQTLPDPPAGAKVLTSGSTSVKAGSVSNLFVPTTGTFYIDYAVEPGKELLLTILTGAQYQAISAGRKAEGQPVMRHTVSGSGTYSVQLGRGTYHVAFTGGGNGTQLSYRGSFK